MPAPTPWQPPDPLPLPIAGRRVLVRAFSDADAPALHAAIDASRASLLPWLPWARTEHGSVHASRQAIRLFARQQTYADADSYVLGIFAQEDGHLLGGTGLHRIDRATATAEVGYWLRHDRRGEGLCSEAVALLTTSAFRDWGLRRLVIRTAGGNARSQAVPRRLGWRPECHERQARWVEGAGWQDDLAWAILADEWDAARGRGPSPQER